MKNVAKRALYWLKECYLILADPEVGRDARLVARLLTLYTSYDLLGLTNRSLVIAQTLTEAVLRLLTSIEHALAKRKDNS